MQYSKLFLAAILTATAAADFTVWRVTEMKAICVDAHCKAEPQGYSLKAAKSGDCDHPPGGAETLDGKGAFGTGDGFIWKDGICGSVKDYKCTKKDDGSFDCARPSGEGKANCVGNKPDEAGEMFICHAVFGGNDVYNQILQCKGDVNC